ncbi:MAG: ABC transporter substrate-binding protein [Peptostreptococcaceae bacterium]|nr:ABC transporter substrate-binding protein [Peptostreptococcaceae bacterium]
MKKLLSLLLIIIVVFTLSACGGEETSKIVVGEGDWDSNAFHDQVFKFIVENGYDTEVDVVVADTAVMISGLKTKDIDLTLELWSENIPTYSEDIDNGDYIELSLNFDDNMQGLYVPRYLVEGDDALAPDLKTVKDLNKYAELFPDPEDPEIGIIYGGPEGWDATEMLHSKMEEYGLDENYNFRTIDSSATLSATLSAAYEKGEPWVGYNWEPTWIMGLYDMVLLEDSEYNAADYENGIGAFPSVNVMVDSTPEFVDDFPEVAEFAKNYTTSSALTSEALAYMQENEVESEDAAIWFLKEHEKIWKPMVSDEAYDKVIEALK